MAMNEAQLKAALKERLAQVYVLYGEESYLVEQYMRLLVKRAVGDENDAFNLHRFDGQAVTPEQIGEAVEALPLMADYTCVTVRDMDLATHREVLAKIVRQMPDTCVLVFWQMTVGPDRRKDWTGFFEDVESYGCVVNFARKTPADVVKLLVSGAKRRGCALSPEDARLMTEQTGNDLNLLLGELDKFCALADGGAITRAMIERAGTKNLETKVFDLSKTLLAGRRAQAYTLLNQLFEQREEPVSILATLSNAYADLYRAKVAVAGGVPATALAEDIKSYKNKEFRLRNAARDASRLSAQTLRACLAVLAQADLTLKTSRAESRVLLEQTVTQLMELTR